MKAAAYSGTPLPKKLGIKDGHSVLLLGAPPSLVAVLAGLDVTIARSLSGKRLFDVALVFVSSQAELETRFGAVQARLEPRGGLWIGWPKKASGIATDLSDLEVRRHGLGCGLVDNKVCAIDETWSGLRFVRKASKSR